MTELTIGMTITPWGTDAKVSVLEIDQQQMYGYPQWIVVQDQLTKEIHKIPYDSDEYEEFASEEEDDGQPDEYTEWQDYMGGDDWDHGQCDGDY